MFDMSLPKVFFPGAEVNKNAFVYNANEASLRKLCYIRPADKHQGQYFGPMFQLYAHGPFSEYFIVQSGVRDDYNEIYNL